MRKNCSSDREGSLKFGAEGGEFSKVLRSLEQFIQTVKGQQNVFLTCFWRFSHLYYKGRCLFVNTAH